MAFRKKNHIFAIDKFKTTKHQVYEDIRLYLSFLRWCHCRRSHWSVTRPGEGLDDFCKKHDIKLARKDADDLVDDIKDAVDSTNA